MNPYKEILRKFFSEYVSALRKRRGLTQEQMAEKLLALGYQSVYDFGGVIDWPYELVKEG